MRPIERFGGFVADRGVALLRGGAHRDLVAEGGGHGFLGPQVNDARVAVDQDRVAVQRLLGDALGMNDKRDRKRPRDDGGVACDRAFLQHDATQRAPVIQELRRPDIAGHKDRVVGHLCAGVLALARQQPQQPVRQIIEVVQALAQVGVRHGLHPGAGRRLLLFHGCLSGQAPGDVLFHAPHPAAGIGKHPVGLKHLDLLGIALGGIRQHLVDRHAQLVHRLVEAAQFLGRVLCHGVRDDDARLVQPDTALGRPFLADAAMDHDRFLVPRRHCLAFADEGAKLGHLGQHHGHHFQRVDFVIGKGAGFARLDDENAQFLAKALDRNAKEGRKGFFARFRHVAETGLGRRVIGVDRPHAAGNPAHQAFAHTQPGNVHGPLREALRGAKLQRDGVAEEVDRADFTAERVRDDMGDPVEPFLARASLGQGGLQAAQELAAFGFCPFGHEAFFPGSQAGPFPLPKQ